MSNFKYTMVPYDEADEIVRRLKGASNSVLYFDIWIIPARAVEFVTLDIKINHDKEEK